MLPSAEVLLDNPIWYALSTEQSSFAQGNQLAKRFPSDVAPFAGLMNQSAATYSALEEIVSGNVIALFLDSEPVPPSNWEMTHTGLMYQMVYEGPPPIATDNELSRKLEQADVPEMTALTKLTEPGPFLPRTIQLGTYLGIHHEGTLVAMAGERLHLTGYTEASAVCTHPDFRGRGYGNLLLAAVISGILQRGETPFLHVRKENVTAICLYEKMGFTVRGQLHLAVIKNR